MAAKPIPEGYEGVTPYLIVNGAAAALDFYKKAFGATELFRMAMPGGKIGHAEIRIGKGIVMLADAHPEMGYEDPKKYGGTPVSLMFDVEDVDAVFRQAIQAGAKKCVPWPICPKGSVSASTLSRGPTVRRRKMDQGWEVPCDAFRYAQFPACHSNQ